eukprot:4568785-Prymnesium_polylepis.1
MAVAGVRQRRKPTAAEDDVVDKPSPLSVAIDTTLGLHLGVTLANYTAGALNGVVVQELNEQDLVKKAGLNVGDVIVAVNSELVTTHAQALALLESGGTVYVRFFPKAMVLAAVEAVAAPPDSAPRPPQKS